MSDTSIYLDAMRAAFNKPKQSNEERWFGPPGCGKTTTLTRLITDAAKQYGSDKVMVASFTKAAAVELVGKNLPIDSDQVGTLHALCYRALGMPPIAETRMSEWNAEHPNLMMTASAAGNDDPSWDMSSRTETDRMMASYQTQRSRLIAAEEMQCEGIFNHPDFVDFVTKWEAWKQANEYLDFTDMLSVSLRDFETAPGDPSIMFLDEAQDLAPLELSVARKWAKSMDRLVIASDDDQALYSFRGADPELIFREKPRSQEVLSQSYRVPRAVHALANAWVKQLSWRVDKEYLPRDADGFAETLWAADFGNPGPAVARAKDLIAEGKTVMFLASCSYMLRGTIAALREEGVAFHNPYKQRRGDWNPLAVGTEGRKTATDRVMAYCKIRPDVFGKDAHVWTADEFRLWATTINGKGLFKRGVKSQLASRDFAFPHGDTARLEAIGNLLVPESSELPDLEHFGNALEGDLPWLMSRLAGETGQRMRYPATIAQKMGPRALLERPRCIVGTGHSVKGGEADIVFVIPDLSWAGQQEWDSVGPRRDSVRRLGYVMLTRAREGVYLMGNAGAHYMPLWEGLK